jgi:TRAP-type C4-dicarboxylate transport system permease small subunit
MGFPQIVNKFAKSLNVLAGFCLFGMTALTCSDVILRFLGHPILGAYEIICFLSAGTAAFAVADTTLQRGHVAVEILIIHLSAKLQTIIYIITHILSIFLFILVTYECFLLGYNLQKYKEVSMTLKIPYFPILYGISFAALVICFILLIDLVKVFKGEAQAWYKWEE